jgi:hypothetical protein
MTKKKVEKRSRLKNYLSFLEMFWSPYLWAQFLKNGPVPGTILKIPILETIPN